PGRRQLDRLPAHLRLRLQHDRGSGRSARLDQAAGPEDLRDRLRALRDGVRRGPDRGALRDPARGVAPPAPAAPLPMTGGRGAVPWALLLAGGVLMVTPFVYMLSTSLKPNAEVYELSLLPRAPTLANYRRLLGASGFPRWFGNSLAIATATTLSVLFFDSLVGYTLAKFRFRGRGV